MADLKLFYGLNYCGATDCVSNHISKVSKIEENIVFHFDAMLIENRLKPYFLPHITKFSRITHLQYMDTLGIIHLVNLSNDTVDFPIVNFRFLARNFNMFGFEIYGLNKPHIYYDIEKVELYNDHLNKFPPHPMQAHMVAVTK